MYHRSLILFNRHLMDAISMTLSPYVVQHISETLGCRLMATERWKLNVCKQLSPLQRSHIYILLRARKLFRKFWMRFKLCIVHCIVETIYTNDSVEIYQFQKPNDTISFAFQKLSKWGNTILNVLNLWALQKKMGHAIYTKAKCRK